MKTLKIEATRFNTPFPSFSKTAMHYGSCGHRSEKHIVKNYVNHSGNKTISEPRISSIIFVDLFGYLKYTNHKKCNYQINKHPIHNRKLYPFIILEISINPLIKIHNY